MNRQDKQLLAAQYAKRRIKEGVPPAQAARVAAELYGLSTRAEIGLVRQLKTEVTA